MSTKYARPSTIGIRGAGLSGLSVAYELLQFDPTLKITMYDTRPRLPHPQRTFCFFDNKTVSNHHIPSHSWNTVMFSGHRFRRQIDVSSRPYTMIRGDDFFGHMLEVLEKKGVCFEWQCRAVELRDTHIATEHLNRSFDVVIDAAFEANGCSSILWQSFAGLWISTEIDIFDQSTAMLMDLDPINIDSPIGFMYILPTSTRTALVEHTAFAPTPISKESHIDRCLAWITQHAGSGVQLGASEYGVIPMGIKIPAQYGHLVVGSAAGFVRPATGYAFVRTQQQARRIALQLLTGKEIRTKTHPLWLEVTDRLFLRALLHAPDHATELMTQLLSRTPGDRLVSFLSDSTNFLDALPVWLCTPKRLMLRALLRL